MAIGGTVPSFASHGVTIFYRAADGRRTPGGGATRRQLLLLLPGNTASSANLRADLRYFAHRFRAVAMDPPGTGRSGRLPMAWEPDWWERAADGAAALIDHLGEPQAILAGASGGGVIALLAAISHPSMVRAVIADSVPERLSTEALFCELRRRLQDAPQADASAGPPLTRLRDAARSTQHSAFWRTAHGRDWRSVVAADSDLMQRLAAAGGWDPFAGRLCEVRCPVLLTGSMTDECIVDLGAQMEGMAAQIPDCRTFLWPEGGHPLMWSQRGAFRHAADEFLTEQTGD